MAAYSAALRARLGLRDTDAKGLRLIFLAFFFPLAVYLLVLGFLNRGRHPLLVSGVWDGIGLIFGLSGFLLFAGPAVLSTLNERWRLYWLTGMGDISFTGPEGAWPLWLFLALLYFLVVVGGAALYLWRQRRLTAIYNTNAALVERLVADICNNLGLEPVCSGGLFVFGHSPRPEAGQVQTAIVTSPSGDRKQAISIDRFAQIDQSNPDSGRQQQAILEVDSFPLLNHVTLRWAPADSPLRRIVETELSGRLSETYSEDSLLGGWLLTLGFVLLSSDLLVVFVLVLLNLRMLLR